MEIKIGSNGKRLWRAEDRESILNEHFIDGLSISELSRKYSVHACQLYNWRRLMKQGSRKAIEANQEVVGISEVKELKKRIRELERALGKKTMECEILKEGIEIIKEETLLKKLKLQRFPSEDGGLR